MLNLRVLLHVKPSSFFSAMCQFNIIMMMYIYLKIEIEIPLNLR